MSEAIDVSTTMTITETTRVVLCVLAALTAGVAIRTLLLNMRVSKLELYDKIVERHLTKSHQERIGIVVSALSPHLHIPIRYRQPFAAGSDTELLKDTLKNRSHDLFFELKELGFSWPIWADLCSDSVAVQADLDAFEKIMKSVLNQTEYLHNLVEIKALRESDLKRIFKTSLADIFFCCLPYIEHVRKEIPNYARGCQEMAGLHPDTRVGSGDQTR